VNSSVVVDDDDDDDNNNNNNIQYKRLDEEQDFLRSYVNY
jgi:hypothetical protein